MQRLFTIEVRVDYKDDNKQGVMEKAMQQAARHIFTNASLLSDHIKPQVVLYSHDYFTGHKDIPLLPDDVASGSGGGAVGVDSADDVSPELYAALKSAGA